MTVLLIDAGNSRVKFGWRRERDYQGRHPAREPGYQAFDYKQLSLGLPAWLRSLDSRPRLAFGTNVAGSAIAELIAELLDPGHCPITWVAASGSLLGLHNGYRAPAKLGADRWMGMIGVWAGVRHQTQLASDRAPQAHLLAHFGTATTLDTIDSGGHFVGGLILPGHDMMRRSLATGTAQLPVATGLATAFPLDTHDAIASGIGAAQAGAVIRQWQAIRERYGSEPALHVTGGAWPLVESEVRHLLKLGGSTQEVDVVDNPVLDGLACLAEASPVPPAVPT